MARFGIAQAACCLLLTLVFTLPGYAAYGAPYCANPTGEVRGPLFRVDRNGHSAILFGTVHNATDAMLQLVADKVAPLIDQADILVTENGLPHGGLPITLQQSIKTLPSVADTLGPERSKAWAEVLHSSTVSRYKTLNLLFAIASHQTAVSSALGINHEMIEEDVLMQRAEKMGKPLMRLETDEWVGQIARISQSDWLLYTDHALAYLREAPLQDTQDNAYRHVAEAWKRGDVDAIESQAVDDEERMIGNGPLLWNRLLNQRTRLMENKIERFLADPHGNRYFIAVGAGHLGGPMGLLAQLKERGYSVACL